MAEASGSLVEDIAYLTRSEHRVTTLIDLTVRPRSRSELWEAAGVSSSTIRRTLREFEDRGWIRRDEYRYETTKRGAFIASAMADLIERFDTERQLRDVWQWLPDEDSGFTIDMCTGATVTRAEGDDPYAPVNRFVSLLHEADEFRFVGIAVALLEPCKSDLCHRIVDGMSAEIIIAPKVAQYIRSSCPDLFSEALDSGNLTVRLHDELPSYGVGVFDDRIGISGYDAEGASVRVLVDSDNPEARDWGESIVNTYWRQTPTVSLETGAG
jgi:predicted transcriptional regulator